MRMYLALMLREFVSLQLRAIQSNVGKEMVRESGSSNLTACLNSIGVDQGIHNMLLHNQSFAKYVSCSAI